MAQKPDPKKLLVDMQDMIESDLMKARHYLKAGVKVAVIAEDSKRSLTLASFYTELDDITDRFSKYIRGIEKPS